MLGQSWWTNIEPALGQFLMFAANLQKCFSGKYDGWERGTPGAPIKIAPVIIMIMVIHQVTMAISVENKLDTWSG